MIDKACSPIIDINERVQWYLEQMQKTVKETCNSCNHWQWPYIDDGDFHFCCHPKVGSRTRLNNGNDVASIENRGDATGIETGGKFGCVHWEQLTYQKTSLVDTESGPPGCE